MGLRDDARRMKASLGVLALGVVMVSACSTPEVPDALVELRRMSGSQALAVSREAAPDLVAEAGRSLQRAEAAMERRDAAQARWMATLGGIQARIAVAVARQQAAEARSSEATRALREVEEDIARYESQRDDALRELERLERLRESTESADPSVDP